ncbi:MAG: C1 family peptidase [Bacteroidales bacterium]|nr:C1 family peptidase [Bacteroidales bacterium]
MKKRKITSIFTASALLLGASTLQSCDEDGDGHIWDDILTNIVDVLSYNGHEYSSNSGDNYFGWFGLDEDEENIQDDINTATLLTDGSGLPSRVDNRKWLPAIGNQGQYGTCVAWATAYNCRTYLYAKSKGLTTSSLNSSNTFSPADIFMSIGTSDKGSNCGGSYFEAAFNKMISRGVATMSTAPYESLNCNSSPSSSWNTNASNYKIKSFREITPLSKSALKQYLAQGDLIVFGAELGDEFMQSDGSTVLTQQTSFNTTGQHAYHAMVCAGYDDSKGSNGAFLVVNSWGTYWGDNGYIWVDQDFFVSGKFAYCAFVASDGSSSNTVVVDEDTKNVSDDDVQQGSVDLIAADNFDFFLAETSNGTDWYECDYNVYNAGSETVYASSDWAICLLYYNAYNANDYGILLLDYYSDDLGAKNTWKENWDKTSAYNHFGYSSSANISGFSWNNIDIPGGYSCAKVLSQVKGEGTGSCFGWQFTLPDITGQYYLVLVADAFDCISETDEENNYLFFGDLDGNPITFENGVPSNISDNRLYSKAAVVCPAQNSKNRCQDVRNDNNLNAYTSDEIAAMIKAHKEAGMLAAVPQSLSKTYVPNTVKVRKKTIN